jgi:hypothetical protein
MRAMVLGMAAVLATLGLAVLPGLTPAGATTGVATHLVVSTPKTLAEGTGITVKVTAETATDTVATTYTGTVDVTSSDPEFVQTYASTLRKGKGTFASGLFTPGDQTITAKDTVHPSISGSSVVDVVRPSAVVVDVTGSPLGDVTASPEPVTPPFSQSATNYVLYCPSEAGNKLTFTLSAVAGGTITAGGKSGAAVTLSEKLMADQALVLDALVTGGKKRAYWIRCLPPGFPVLQSTVSKTPPPGWILTGTGKDNHYVIVLSNVGTPVWWRSTGQFTAANLLVLEHDDLGWGWGFTDENIIYDLDTGATQELGTNAHELQQLPDGDYLSTYSVPLSGVNLTGIGLGTNQTIGNCEMQEYTPQLQLVWTWSAYTHVSPDESTLPTFSDGEWDVYHCNSIAADPNSADPTNPNLLLSMRDTSGVYYVVNPEAATDPGQVLWKLGGVAPIAGTPDANAKHYVVTGDADNGFVAQHDARFQATGQISVFDDGSPPQDSSTCSHAARGVEFSLDPTTLAATVTWQYTAPSGKCATYEGSFRRYDDGNDNMIGWGSATGDFISEVNATGQPILTVSSPQGLDNYRAVKVAPTSVDIDQLRQDMGGLAPEVTGVSPATGSVTGGTVVTLTGDGFTQASGVRFGTLPASSFTVNSDTSITVTSPPASVPGKVNVKVTNTAGTSLKNKKAKFTYTG